MTTLGYITGSLTLMVLLVYLEWRTWDVARGFAPPFRWLIAWIDLNYLLPIVLAALAAVLHWLLSFSLSTLSLAVPFAAITEGVKEHPGAIAAPAMGHIIYKCWFFYLVSRWEIGRGLFNVPAWPRELITRGSRRRRHRQFREPLPWTRGPGSW